MRTMSIMTYVLTAAVTLVAVHAQDKTAVDGPKSEEGAQRSAPVPTAPTRPERVAPPAVPEGVKAELALVKKDLKEQNDLMQRINQAYAAAQAVVQNDNRELGDITTRAVVAVKLDPDKWELADDGSKFVEKTKKK